jgi:PAS domain S-box-containing protein
MVENLQGPEQPRWNAMGTPPGRMQTALEHPEELPVEETRRLLRDLLAERTRLELDNEALRQTQDELAAARERYFDLYDLAPVGYFTLTAQGLITEVNLTATRLLDLPRNELLRLPLATFIHPEDQELYQQRCRELTESGTAQVFELRMRKQDGPAFWARLEASVSQDLAWADLFRVVVSDISELKCQEEALRESEERFRRVLQDVPTVAVQGYDMDGTTRYWNQASERLYGYSAQEALGKDLRDLIIPPEMRELVTGAIQWMAETGQPIPSGELSLLHKNGSRIAVISSHAVVRIPGRPTELFCIDVDIREHKAVEDAQRFLLERTHSTSGEDFFLSLARYLAGVLQMHYVCIDRLAQDSLEAETLAVFNDGLIEPNLCYTLRDTPCGDVVGKAICCFPSGVRQLFPKDAALQELGAESYVGTTLWSSQGKPIGLIAVIGRKNLANPRLAETLLKLVAPRASAELEWRQAEEERRRLEERMNQVQRLEALGFLAAGISHNLNNVLAAILGLASARELVATQPKDQEAYQVICKACERGREVLDSLLRFARPDLGGLAPLELNGILGELRRILDHTTRMRIAIQESFSPEPLWVLGEAGSMSHALMNLCVNAVNAMPGGGVLTLRTQVTEDGRAEVSVEDSGAGMTPEVLAHALEPFYTTRPIGEGTGLGLSMAYGTVKAHGGTLDISSQVGQGTRVRLQFPRLAAPVRAEPGSRPSRRPRALRVLLVDDDELVRFATVGLLELAGCQATAVAGGAAALESLRSCAPPDLVLLDLNMPAMDGKETLQGIRALQPDLPVIIVSGQPGVQDWEGFKQPHVGVVTKPFTVEELLDAMARLA